MELLGKRKNEESVYYSIKTLKIFHTKYFDHASFFLQFLIYLPTFNFLPFLSLCLQNKQTKLKTNKTPKKHTHTQQKINKIKSSQTKKYYIKLLQK